MTLSLKLKHQLGPFSLDLSFKTPAGVTALFGKSGSGKTTVVNSVAGLLRPDVGHIEVDGETLVDTDKGIFRPPHRRNVGYVFQDARLFPHLSVRQNLLYGAPKGQVDELDRIAELLDIVPLIDRRIGALSGGEKQRVAIGRALLSNPRILLMDEPLAALDEPRKAEILPYIERLAHEAKIPILYVSHSLSEVARLASTLVILSNGRIARAGPATQLFSDPETAPLLGLREAGAILTARVTSHTSDGLSALETAGGQIFLPQIQSEPGTNLRLRIHANDVMLALSRPSDLSALNILKTRVKHIKDGDGPGMMVALDMGGETLLARVTRRSATALNLREGLEVFAIIKSVSTAQADVSIAT